MRKFVSLFLLLSLVALSAASLFAQTRPRRVGQSQTPATTAAPSPAPARQPSSTSGARAGQQQRTQEVEEVGEDEVIRVATSLVTIPVSVLDRDGRFIPGLRKGDFRILEDGVEHEIAVFAPVEQPFTVALVIDTSRSTRFRLEDIQDAAIAFVDQLRLEDRVMVVSFDDSINVLAEPTSDRRELGQAIRRTRTGGGTKLYDAMDFVINQRFERIKGRKAVVLFTDGVDTTSRRASFQSNVADAEELDAMIYPIQYDTYADVGGSGGGGTMPGGNPTSVGDIISIIIGGGGRYPRGGGGGGAGTSREDYRRAGEYLREMAYKTGGRHHQANDLGYLERAFTNIAEELRRQYSLGYYPKRQAQSSERRQIRVRVKRPNLVVRARDSYVYKPAGSTDTAQQDGNQQRQQGAPELRRRQFANDR